MGDDVEALKPSPNDVGDIGEVVVTKSSITAVYHRVHWECGSKDFPKTTPSLERFWIESQMRANFDFIALSEYEATGVGNEITAERQGGTLGDQWGWYYGMIGATCRHTHTEPMRLYFNYRKWTMVDSYPKSEACLQWGGPPGGDPAVAPWKCGKTDVVPNAGEGVCCSCTYSADKATFPEVADRAWVAGLFQQTNAGKATVCVVAAGLPRPPQTDGRGTGTIGPEVAKFCGSFPIIFMADTNLVNPNEKTGSLFQEAPLSNLRDFPKPTFTCCRKSDPPQFAAMDRIAVTGGLVIETITGGVSSKGATNIPDGMGYQCGSTEEHLPLRATITVP